MGVLLSASQVNLQGKIYCNKSVTAFMLCDIMKEAGLPDGVVNMVFGDGPNTGAPLINHERVPLISFTGGILIF